MPSGAVYVPSGNFLGSPSNTLAQVVNAAPLAATATKLSSSANPATVGQAVTFTAVVNSAGAGTPVGNVTFTIDGGPQAPVALEVVGGVDEATFTTSSLSAGSHSIGATYNGGPGFASSPASPLNESITPAVTQQTPPITDGPKITLVQRYGYHMMPTSVVLTFDQALDAVAAEDASDYRIIGPAGRTIAIEKAVYDAADFTVTLYPVDRVNIHHTYKLIVDGTSPNGLTNTQGQLLDGTNKGSPDSNYVGTLSWRNLVLDPRPPGKCAMGEGKAGLSLGAGARSGTESRVLHDRACGKGRRQPDAAAELEAGLQLGRRLRWGLCFGQFLSPLGGFPRASCPTLRRA